MQEGNTTIPTLSETQVDDELAAPLLFEIKSLCQKNNLRIVVLDDDPTGTQTVYDIPVLTDWNELSVLEILQEPFAGFFILTNTRSLSEEEAVIINKQIAERIKKAAAIVGCSILLISRSDSTLRGHFPSELLALEDGWGENFDGYILMPYFKEGNRFTFNNIHYLLEHEQLVPVASTDFAKDSVFGFSYSDLRYYIEEKTEYATDHTAVKTVSIGQLNEGAATVENILETVNYKDYVVVNGTCLCHASVFALALIRQQLKNKRFLIRCAASLVQALFGIPGLKLLSPADIVTNKTNGGLIIVGSYVSRSSDQLRHLLANSSIDKIEVNAKMILSGGPPEYLENIAKKINQLIANGKSVVLYTSRELVSDGDVRAGHKISSAISQALVVIIKQLTVQPSFIIAKGGITSSDIATKSLGIKKAMIAGQLLPGIPVWIQGSEAKFPGMPYIIFPGNVGTPDYLTNMYQMLNTVLLKSAIP